MREIEVGIEISLEYGFRCWGTEQVNQAIENGERILRIKGPSANTKMIGKTTETATLAFVGSSVIFFMSE